MEHSNALARIDELTEKVSSWQAQCSSEKERGDALQAKAKDDVDAVMSELDQLRAELASEQAGRASDASNAAADAEQMNATIQRLQDDLSRGDVARENVFKETADKVSNLSEQLDAWKSKHAEAVAEARSMSEEAAAEKAQLLEPPG